MVFDRGKALLAEIVMFKSTKTIPTVLREAILTITVAYKTVSYGILLYSL